jgi:hypothetical protein
MPPRKYKTRAPKRRAGRRPAQYRGKKFPMYRPVAAQTHLYKRLGKPLIISNQGAGVPLLNDVSTGLQISPVQNGPIIHTCDFGIGASFRLQDVQDPNEFTALYDRYKIVGVKLKFMYQMASAQDQQNWNAGSPPVVPLPIIDYSFDADDSDIPVTRAFIQSKGYCKTRIMQSNSTFKTYYTPRVNKLLFNSGGITTKATEKSCWIDCKSAAVDHFGFKAWVSAWPFDPQIVGTQQFSSGVLTIQPVYYIAFRDSQ